jgi:signal transduction histidine kinase
MRSPRSVRAKLSLSVAVAAAVVVVLLVAAFNVLIGRSLDRAERHALQENADVAIAGLTVRDGRIEPRTGRGDLAHNEVWVYEGRRVLTRAPGYERADAEADALAGRSDTYADADGGDLRLFAQALREGDRQVGTVVSVESRQTYTDTRRLALLGSIALGLAFLVAVVALSWEIVRRALEPVRHMARTAADWTANDLDRRFRHEPRNDELGELERTFDAMLDRVAASLRHEQRFSAELSHELRTPLARMVAELDLLRSRDRSPEERRRAYDALARNAHEMERIVDMLMASGRVQTRRDAGRSAVRPTLEQLAGTWGPALAEHGAAIEVHVDDEQLHAGVDAAVVERIITPLLENAARFARADVTLSARRANGHVVVEVCDDGPGIDADEREAVFEPGRSGARVNGHAGAGLGLALSRRLARAAGGDLLAADPPDGRGARLTLTLPSA